MSHEQDKYALQSKHKGAFIRPATKFHSAIGQDGFTAEPGRYRLYVSYACPWAHRTYIVYKLKGLENVIDLTITGYRLDNISTSLGKGGHDYPDYKGWDFEQTSDKSSPFYEPHGFTFIDELYELGSPGYREEYKSLKKRPIYSVPVLFDQKSNRIVSNESAEIIVMLNDSFNAFAKNPTLDLNPKHLQDAMEKVNAVVYPSINDGVYRCGFARSQQAYEEAYRLHWDGMDKIEKHLSSRRYLCGNQLTLSDIRLFVTLIRYDPVYYGHFKTSRNRIVEMPNLYGYMRDIYQDENVKSTLNMQYIVKHYYGSQLMINPTGIWPVGSFEKGALDHLNVPANREKLSGGPVNSSL